MKEIVNDSGPSPASGISIEDYTTETSEEDADDSTRDHPGILWLVEPKRTPLTDHWSGTMQFPNSTNKPGKTMSAFTHFSWVFTKETMVLADLQSKYFALLHLQYADWI